MGFQSMISHKRRIKVKKNLHDIAKKLGANRSFAVKTDRGGPLSWLQLSREVASRLRSTGGRPSDPEWQLYRQVPFKEQTWQLLTCLARNLKDEGTSAGPGQIAAILVERQLRSLPPDLQRIIKQKFKHIPY